MAKIYTDAQIDFLRIKYKKHTLKDVVKMFNLKFGMNKKEGTIQAALFRNGIKYGHKKRPSQKEHSEKAIFRRLKNRCTPKEFQKRDI